MSNADTAPRLRVICPECQRTVRPGLLEPVVGPHKNWEGAWCTGAWTAPAQIVRPT